MEHSPNVSRGLAEVISTRLVARGISRRSAADSTGIPLTTLTRRLTGASPFSVTELAAFADLFDVALSDLAGEAEALADAVSA